jgi:hypothetical protein
MSFVAVKVTHRSAEDSQEILNDGFQQLFNGEESIEAMLYRKDAFKESWDSVNKTINVHIYLQLYQLKRTAHTNFS